MSTSDLDAQLRYVSEYVRNTTLDEKLTQAQSELIVSEAIEVAQTQWKKNNEHLWFTSTTHICSSVCRMQRILIQLYFCDPAHASFQYDSTRGVHVCLTGSLDMWCEHGHSKRIGLVGDGIPPLFICVSTGILHICTRRLCPSLLNMRNYNEANATISCELSGLTHSVKYYKSGEVEWSPEFEQKNKRTLRTLSSISPTLSRSFRFDEGTKRRITYINTARDAREITHAIFSSRREKLSFSCEAYTMCYGLVTMVMKGDNSTQLLLEHTNHMKQIGDRIRTNYESSGLVSVDSVRSEIEMRSGKRQRIGLNHKYAVVLSHSDVKDIVDGRQTQNEKDILKYVDRIMTFWLIITQNTKFGASNPSKFHFYPFVRVAMDIIASGMSIRVKGYPTPVTIIKRDDYLKQKIARNSAIEEKYISNPFPPRTFTRQRRDVGQAIRIDIDNMEAPSKFDIEQNYWNDWKDTYFRRLSDRTFKNFDESDDYD